jgi:surface polysaccharide O-acyltransferase-like enzyme
MLDFLDKFLEMAFAYGPPVIIGIWGVVACILFLGVMANKDLQVGKGKILGQIGIHIVCVWGFFHWYAEMLKIPQPEGYSHIPALTAMFVFVVVTGISYILINVAKIPAFIIFLIYLGIAIWGV